MKSWSTTNRRSSAFTLVELLVVIAIIALLMSIALPALGRAREAAESSLCLSNLHQIAVATAAYQADHRGYFWPTARFSYPDPGDRTYFWGEIASPVRPEASWLMSYLDNELGVLHCPQLHWGDYVPQGGVNEPTTEYGYNAWCLDPAFWGRRDEQGKLMKRKQVSGIERPTKLFVMADSAMFWAPGGVGILQNSTSLDPVTFPWGPNTTPTNHFRHRGKTQALTVDGHAARYEPAHGRLVQPDQQLGFVDTGNVPHYDQ